MLHHTQVTPCCTYINSEKRLEADLKIFGNNRSELNFEANYTLFCSNRLTSKHRIFKKKTLNFDRSNYLKKLYNLSFQESAPKTIKN